MKSYPDAFLREIPKTDLHVHLDGSLRLSTLIELAKKGGVDLPSFTEGGMRELVFKPAYASLPEYLRGFAYTCAVLRDPENLERVAYELACDCQAEGVLYVEPRFAPQLLMDGDLSLEAILQAVDRGLSRAAAEFNRRPEVREGRLPPFRYGLIACAMRMFGSPGFSPYYDGFFRLHRYAEPMEVIRLAAAELARGVVRARDDLGLPVVGFDIAGQEAGYPAGQFREAFDYVHEHFMHTTVHAGEAYGAESIFQAITDLHADRLGHGYFLFDPDRVQDPRIGDRQGYTERLAAFIADQRITIEVCLTSNLQTNPALGDLRRHSFGKMLARSLSATICTDNRLVSDTTATKEIGLAISSFDLSPRQLKNLIVYGFKRSFYPGPYAEKREYVRRVISHYEAVAERHGVVAGGE